MRREAFWIAMMLAVPCAASAQHRPVSEVPEIDEYALSSLIVGQQRAIERCASRTDASSYVATVEARITAGAAPSTLFNARIAISVSSRPQDGEFEECVRSELRDTLRHARYAVGRRAVRARHTFQIAERPASPIETPAPPYSESEVRGVLRASSGSLQQCLEMAGVPERVTLRVSVRPDGRLVLMSADVPPGSSQGALGCLSSRVSSLRVSGRPGRTVTIVHELSVRNAAW
jgi:hypothetical protein